jgi:hypothetical protein
MKKFAFQNRVLQRDRVLERRVLEREYCIRNVALILNDLIQRVVQSKDRILSANDRSRQTPRETSPTFVNYIFFHELWRTLGKHSESVKYTGG